MPDLQTGLKKVKLVLQPKPLAERVWLHLKENGPKTRKQLIATLQVPEGSLSRIVWLLKANNYIKSERLGHTATAEELLTLVNPARPYTGMDYMMKGKFTAVKNKASPALTATGKQVLPNLQQVSRTDSDVIKAVRIPEPIGPIINSNRVIPESVTVKAPIDIQSMPLSEAYDLFTRLKVYFGD